MKDFLPFPCLLCWGGWQISESLISREYRLGGVVVEVVVFSFVTGDVVCDLVGNGLLSLDAIFNFQDRAIRTPVLSCEKF